LLDGKVGRFFPLQNFIHVPSHATVTIRAFRSVIDEPTGENRLQVAVYRWQVALQRKLGNEFAVVIQNSSLANVHSIRRVFLHGTQVLSRPAAPSTSHG